MLSDGIFVKAKAKEGVNKVSLWLGASTIVQLTYDEAEKLLRENLSNAKKSSKQITEELEYVRDQRTTTEVNVARVYNHSLVEKREAELRETQKKNEDD
jgi:YD repeat-containing protein